MNCTKCSKSISQQRLKALPNTNVCVNCSTVEAVGCVDICYHKTGNTIQVMDKESAAKINKLSQRAGYGIMRGLRGGSTPKSKTKIMGNSGRVMRMPTREDFEAAGKRVMTIMDSKGKDSAIKYIDEVLESRMISGSHHRQLKEIVNTFMPDPVVEYSVKETVIDEEIQFAFRNWKNSKIYK
jgi:hypothetical protein